MDFDPLISILKSTPEMLDSRNRFANLLHDLFPNKRVEVNLLLDAYDLNIMSDIKSHDLDSTLRYRFVKQLIEDFAVDQSHAESAVDQWFLFYGNGVLHKQILFSQAPSHKRRASKSPSRPKVGPVHSSIPDTGSRDIKKVSDSAVNVSIPISTDSHILVLRSFPKYTTQYHSSFEIIHNEIHLTLRVQTAKGPRTAFTHFTGNIIAGLNYKKPGLLSSGYISFAFQPTANIVNNHTDITAKDLNSAGALTRISFSQKDQKTVLAFLNRLSEDLHIPITKV